MPSLARGIHEVSVRGQMWREVGLWPTHDRPVSFKVNSSPAHVLGPLPRALRGPLEGRVAGAGWPLQSRPRHAARGAALTSRPGRG